MKPISKNLLDFLDKHVQKKYVSLGKTNPSKFSISLLKDLFRNLIFAEKTYEVPVGSWLTPTSVPKGYDFDYCHDSIKAEIENMNKSICVYSFQIKNHSFQIAFVSPENKTVCEKNFEIYIKRIYIWLYLATIYAPPMCSQKLNIYIYLTNLQKNTPSNREQFSQIHANTAFTTSCKKNTEIHIYREEEWFKVLIHESFHCFGLDFSGENQSQINREIANIFPINSKMNIFEVYCETFAEIINTIFVSHHIVKKIENLEDYIKKMTAKTNELLEKERVFSLFQCAKVLDYYGVKYKELYERTPLATQRRRNYRENDTNIFSYYILKSFFMFFYDDFLAWCFLHNGGSIAFDRKKLPEFIIFIKEHYKHPEFLTQIENMERFFMETYEKNTPVFKTMRMSLFELA